jgi:hypothetical protein
VCRDLAQFINDTSNFDIVFYSNRTLAQLSVVSGGSYAAFMIPENFTTQLDRFVSDPR